MVDLTKVAGDLDGLADRQIKAGGFKLTITSVFAIFAFISTIVGGLYGGFVLYQKIEGIAGLDLGAYQQQMKVMDTKVSGISGKVEESVEYTRDIKNGLREDILGIEKQTDRVEDMVRALEDSVDKLLRENEAKIRASIDAADLRFENQRERVRISQDSAMTELEDRLNAKLQRALDNPLAD
tara:strand:+ start:2343 stop:2888 length:546 start_codon:yes stop_codon:yes gene_type:complete